MAMDMAVGVKINANVQGGQAVDRLNQQLKQLGTQGRQSAAQLAQAYQQLPAQLQDVAVSLAGGQNPLMVLMQQGSQVATSFGGVGNAIQALAATITPLRVAVGGLATSFGVLGLAYYQAESEISDFNKKLALTGNIAGINYDKFRQMAQAVTAVTGSIGNNKDLVLGAVGTGVFGSQSLEPAISAMARFRSISGQTSEEVVKHFAAMASGVTNWAAAQNRAIGYLTLEQFRYIKQLERQGQIEEAMAYNMKLLNAELEARAPKLGVLERAWKSLGEGASWAWDKMLGVGRPTTAADEIAQLQKQLEGADRLRQNLQRNGGRVPEESAELKAARARLAELQDNQREMERLTKKDAELSAQRRRQVEEEASGLNDRKLSASLAKRLSELEAASNERKRLLEFERAAVESYKKRELMDDETYARRVGEIRQKQLDEERRVAQERVRIERARPVKDQADEITKSQKIAEAQAEVRRLEQEGQLNQKRTSYEVLDIQDRKSKALRYYTEDLKHQNEMLALEAYKIEMTDFAYRQLVDTKQREYDIKVKTRGMTVEEAAQYAAAANAAGELKAQLEQLSYQQSRTFEYGAKSALKNYVDEAGNAAKQIESALTSAFRATENTLTDFIVKGKADFGELAQSIASDFVKMALRMFVMKPLLDAVSAFLPGSGFPGISLSTPALTGARAGGGQVSSGGTYLVGENGPEILKLGGQGGNITPNHNLGGGTNVVINNFSNANANARETVDSRGNRRIEVTIGEMVASEMRRAGSSTFNAVRETFGTTPALVGR